MPALHPRLAAARRRSRKLWSFLGAGTLALVVGLLAGLLTGCQAPPARPAACDLTGPGPGRNALLTRQLVVDTAVVAVSRPARGAYNVVTELGVHLRALAAGLFYKGIAFPLTSPPPPLAEERPTLDPDALERKLVHEAGNELRSADVQLFVDGRDALTALHRVIDEAACRLDVLMYLWDSDALGQELAVSLAARAGPNRRVRVLVDGGGNLIHGLPSAATAAEVNRVVCWLAHQPYVEVLRTRDAAARFDHRKLVLADGRLGWSGGRNFTGPSFYEYHDLSYTLDGPLAGEMADAFEEFWQQQGGQPAAPLPPPPPAAEANAVARLVRTRPMHRQLAEVLYTAVDQARHHVYLENPYFTDPRLLVGLAQARRRGADVRVVTTIHGDSAPLNCSNKVMANRLLRVGVRVYLYPTLTHVKALVVDGRWAYLGTGNFDALSLRHNRELGLAVAAGAVITDLEKDVFLPDCRPEWELTHPLPVTVTEYLCEALASLFL